MDKKYQAVHIASLLLLLIVGVPVYGGSDQLLGPLNYTDVAERRAQVRAIMTERLMYPFESINCRNSQYCVELIQAYRAQDKVEYPLPIAAGKDYFDPALDEIKALCPNRLMNSGSTPETGPSEYLTRNLRYWRVDMDGDGDDELVLHGERRVRGRHKYLHEPDRLPEASPAAVIIPDGDGFFVDDPAQRGGGGGWLVHRLFA